MRMGATYLQRPSASAEKEAMLDDFSTRPHEPLARTGGLRNRESR